MEDNLIYVGKTPPEQCPIDDLVDIATTLNDILDALEAINNSDHRDRFISLAITDIQSAQNWLARWFGMNAVVPGEDDEPSIE